MSLYAMTGSKQIGAAYVDFCKHFEAGCDILERCIGCKGGPEPATIMWFPEQKFWTRLQPQHLVNGYGCAFGVDNPHANSLLSITCEINPPYEGINRRCTGVFVRSDNGTRYLAHNGKVGAGKMGVGMGAFLEFYGDEHHDTITWPDKLESQYIIIGALDDDELRSHVACFVHQVAQFKSGAVDKAS